MISHRTYKNKPVVVLFGEVLADIFPDRRVLGGAPFNVARHLHAFGLHPVLISRTGSDALRRELLGLMAEIGMDSRGVQLDVNHPTGQVMVHMQNGEHKFEILPDQAYDHIHAGLTHMITLKVRPDMVYFGTLAQRMQASSMGLTALIRSSKAPRMLDINLRAPWYDKAIIERSLQRAHILKLNEGELTILADMFRLKAKEPVEQAELLLRKFSLEMVLVTCGAEGAWQLNDGGKIIRVEGLAQAQPLMDTVGAGDGFAAVFMLGILRGWPRAVTLARANAFAAAICSIRGAIPQSAAFYEPFLHDWRG